MPRTNPALYPLDSILNDEQLANYLGVSLDWVRKHWHLFPGTLNYSREFRWIYLRAFAENWKGARPR